ncbi:hypothetical protein DUT91_20525 [Phyllobacterium salinisoli]|uniref:Uncharacterized protein n=1 Tax=Phyllobacterium salinisoli TaxID=1899321 RepID=A0A368JY85_9HYPH|nr:hypothetical protein DUT91_20525 [Phyllobacterium salinisoli]
MSKLIKFRSERRIYLYLGRSEIHKAWLNISGWRIEKIEIFVHNQFVYVGCLETIHIVEGMVDRSNERSESMLFESFYSFFIIFIFFEKPYIIIKL